MSKTVALRMMILTVALAAIAPVRASSHPERDPFRVLVRPPAPPRSPRSTENDGPKPVLVKPPLVLQVRAVVGESRRWVALIRYGGDEHIVEAGWAPEDGKFTVRRIDDRGVLVELADAEEGPRQFLF